MSQDNTLARIQHWIIDAGRDPRSYDLNDPNTTIVSLQFDSLEFAQFILDLEFEFEMDVPTEDYKELRTIGDLVKYADSKSLVR